MDLEVAKELVCGLFRPFHQVKVQVVVDVGSILVVQSLGELQVEVVGWSIGFHH